MLGEARDNLAHYHGILSLKTKAITEAALFFLKNK